MSSETRCVDGIHQIVKCHVSSTHMKGANMCLQIACDCGQITAFSVAPDLAHHIAHGLGDFTYELSKKGVW